MRISLSFPNGCLISLVLLSRQTFGARVEPSSIGAPPVVLTPRDLDLLDQKGQLPEELTEETSEAEGFENPTPSPEKSFKATHANGFRQAEKELGQILEAGEVSFNRQSSSLIDVRRLRWDLGLSKDYSLSALASLHEERQIQTHRLSADLTAQGRAFKGSGASLDEIFQGAYRQRKDFTDYTAPESSRIEGGLRLSDVIKVSDLSSLTISGEARQDHYDIKDALDDGSNYQALTVRSLAAFDQDVALDTTLKRSLIAYKDDKNNIEQSQDINEAEALIVAKVSPSYSAGLGFRTLDGERNGPVATLIRRADERFDAQAKVSYLKGGFGDQALGSFRARYNATRLLSFTFNAEQGIDLLAAYSSLAVTGRTDIRQQRITKNYDLTTGYRGKYSLYKLILIANRQDYESSNLSQREARFSIEHPISQSNQVNVLSSLRHYLEEGQVVRPVDRRQSLIDLSWRHIFSGQSRLAGMQIFSELSVAHERLWEGEREKERRTLRMALGQEWN